MLVGELVLELGEGSGNEKILPALKDGRSEIVVVRPWFWVGWDGSREWSAFPPMWAAARGS